jgi:ATP-binding cassette subfamily B protein
MAVKSAPAIILLILAAIGLRPGADAIMSDAALFAGTIIVIRVFASLGQLVTAGSQMLTDIRAVKDIASLIDVVKTLPPSSRGRSDAAIDNLILQEISFGYGDRGPVLRDVSFKFESGHAYAVIGPSGAGKSTLADILLGLTSPDRGAVLVNSGNTSIEMVRHRFMLVEQQPKIFSTTLKENLLLGENAPDQELHAALELVSLGGMVRELPDGIETKLTYLGENFSGGQRQRLGIARALIRKPQVLILDEATSALDPATRKEVVSKLRAFMQQGIIIFITHDAEIAALADKVLTIGREATPPPL